MNLLQFKYHVESVLASGTRAVQAEQFPDLLETLLGSDLHYTIKDEGLKYLAEKAKDVIPKSVLDVIESTESLKGDTEALLAIVANGLSQSLNSIALDVTRRDIHGSDEEDVFAKPMDRLTKGLLGKLHLRGVINEIGINVPDGDDFKEHWTIKLFDEVKSLEEFRSMDWKYIAEKVEGINVQDMSRLEQLFTGKLGPDVGVEHIPKIREQLRSKNVNLGIACEFEKNDKKNITDVTKSDIDSFEFEGRNYMKNVDKYEMRNQLKSIVAGAQKEEEVSSIKKRIMTDEEAFAIGQKIKGGPEVLNGLDNLTDIAPLIAGVTGVAAPQVALAIAATKMLAQEGQNRQREADEMMQTVQQKSREARNEALKLMEELDVKSTTKEQKEQLQKDLELIKSKVKESASFDAVGQHFNSPKLLNDLENNALKLPSSRRGVIESYSSNEKLAASVSGGMTLHGISFLLGEYPIESVSTPILKEPSYVEVYGVNQPFNSSVFKCTKEIDLSTFRKTATAGGMSMAVDMSSSFSVAGDMKINGGIGAISTEGSFGTSAALELARSKKRESESSTENNVKIKKAFLTEYIKMPMRCVRIPYDSMRLSEDAKREIFKMSTLLEAFRFLRKFGSHLSCGEYTLGGVFFRTIAMESKEKVDSAAMFAVAGDTMSNVLGFGMTGHLSGGASAGLFGIGAKMSGSIDSDAAAKFGMTSENTQSNGTGIKTASSTYSYSVTVSSLGPNANTSEEFFNQLNTNTGTWSVIDKGALDHVIPVWDLIRDELFEEENFNVRNKILSEADKKFIKEQRQILRACRLLKRAWATKTREFLESPSPPKLPETMMHTINDFVKVNENIGSMVNCICSLVIPNISAVQDKGQQGNRLSMLKSLQTLVRSAKEAYLLGDGKEEFSYNNWFVKDLLKAGENRLRKRLDNDTKKDMIFPEFDVAPYDDMVGEHGVSVSMEIRRMHAKAIECAGNLTIDAWEDLCDDFINLARLVKMPYFYATEDKERTTTVWNLTSDRGCKRTAYLQTSVDTIHIEAMQRETIYCPDAVSPIDVYAAPPLAYDGKWDWYKILRANRTINRKLYPGVTYYLVREKSYRDSDSKEESAEFLTEGAMLQNGWTIIENAYLKDLKIHIKGKPGSVNLHRNSVHLEAFKKETKMEIALRFRQPEGNGRDQLSEIKEHPDEVFKGKKYLVHYSNEDLLLQSAPRLIELRDKIVENKRNKGSLIISYHSMRRLHVWQSSNCPLNTITKNFCQDFCQDQFWDFDLVEEPDGPGESYEPDELVFTISSRYTKEKLYADIFEADSSNGNFGLVPQEAKVHDSQKWQLLKKTDKEDETNFYYYIRNAYSSRYLGLEESPSDKEQENRVIAVTPDLVFQDDGYCKNFRWTIAPWKLVLKQIKEKETDIKLPSNITEYIPNKDVILKRESLPAENFLKEDGVIINNDFPTLYTVAWTEGNRTSLVLRPHSRVFFSAPRDKNTLQGILKLYSSKKEFTIAKKKEYSLYFEEDDPLCIKIPKIVESEELKELESKERKGYYLIRKDENGNLSRLGGISEKGEVVSFCHKDSKQSYVDQIWNFELAPRKNEFRVFSSSKDGTKYYLQSSQDGLLRALPVAPGNSCTWIIETNKQGDNNSGYDDTPSLWCSIKNKSYETFLTTNYTSFKKVCFLHDELKEYDWTIVKKDDINSVFGGNITCKDCRQAPSIPVLENLEAYSMSDKWRLVGETHSTKDGRWNIQSITFYDTHGLPIEVDAKNAFSSDYCKEQNDNEYPPTGAFDGGTGWRGRHDKKGQCYIGMSFDEPVRVASAKIIFPPDSPNSLEVVKLQAFSDSTQTAWYTVARDENLKQEIYEMKLEVKIDWQNTVRIVENGKQMLNSIRNSKFVSQTDSDGAYLLVPGRSNPTIDDNWNIYNLPVGERDDFVLLAKLKVNGNRSAACFFINDNDNFGFNDIKGNEIFSDSNFLRTGFKNVDKGAHNDNLFHFKVERKHGTIKFYINEEVVASTGNYNVAISKFFWRPWRANLKIYDWTISCPGAGQVLKNVNTKGKKWVTYVAIFGGHFVDSVRFTFDDGKERKFGGDKGELKDYLHLDSGEYIVSIEGYNVHEMYMGSRINITTSNGRSIKYRGNSNDYEIPYNFRSVAPIIGIDVEYQYITESHNTVKGIITDG